MPWHFFFLDLQVAITTSTVYHLFMGIITVYGIWWITQNSLSEVIILPFSIIYFKNSSHLFIKQLYHIFNNIFVVIFV